MRLEKVQLTILASLLFSALAILTAAIVNAWSDQDKSFAFPDAVPLEPAQFMASRPLPTQTPNPYTHSIASHHYQYRYQNQPLAIQITYTKGTAGDLQRFFKNYAVAAIPPPYQPQGEQRQRTGVGFYQLYTHQDRAYLSACIDPGGQSTVTAGQFIQNWNSHWYLLGQDYMDDRCLWTHLSTPVTQTSARQAELLLESAWFRWHQWWRPRFPPQQATSSAANPPPNSVDTNR